MLLQRKRVAFTLVLALALAGALVPFSVQAETRGPTWIDDVLTVELAEAEGDTGASARTSDDAADAPATADDLPTADDEDLRASGALAAPITFSSLWVELPDGVDEVEVRTSPDGTAWSGWTTLERADELDAPDPGTAEAASAEALPEVSDQLFVGEAAHLELRGPDDADELVVRFVDTEGLNESLVARVARTLTPRMSTTTAEAANIPSWVNTRSSWGARAPKKGPTIASGGVRQIVLHHTATPNTDSRDAIPARLRNMQSYHMDANGWDDLGYNVVIDQFGRVWEGRSGGLDRAVVGAHAAGFNTGSTGISVIGNFTSLEPSATVLQALDRVVGWQAGIHGVNTTGRVSIGSSSYPTVVGHRDVGNTTCPGRIQNHLGRIRANAANQAGDYDAAFRDIAGSPHEQAIRDLVDREITQGYDDRTFRPSNDVTRAQVATFLGRALELSPSTGSAFRDVGGSPHEGYIYALVEAGILNGYGDTFRPNEPLRREHMAAILTRALELDLDPAAGGAFSDVRGYVGEIGALRTAGITGGCGTNPLRYCPESSVTRGQMATFLMNALGHLEAGTRPVADDGALEPAAETT